MTIQLIHRQRKNGSRTGRPKQEVFVVDPTQAGKVLARIQRAVITVEEVVGMVNSVLDRPVVSRVESVPVWML